MSVSYFNAQPVLNAAGIRLDENFYTLRADQVETLLDLAQVQGYRKPKNANGSRARYYFAALQRAKRKGV